MLQQSGIIYTLVCCEHTMFGDVMRDLIGKAIERGERERIERAQGGREHSAA